MPDYLIEVKSLYKKFKIKNGFKTYYINAVDNVSFNIKKGQTLGIIGESGSGKTTLGRCILRLTEPDKGKIIYNGADITNEKMKPYRKKMQVIFQDPSSSLDPKMTAKQIISEAIDIHMPNTDGKVKAEKIRNLLIQTGINPKHDGKYPHEFSKGQQQRITIARALAVEPEFIVCDEPTSALDVSVQSQIINLFIELQEKRNLTYLFITHNLAVAEYVSDYIAVMYAGSIVEISNRKEIYNHPIHPYAIDLLNSFKQLVKKKNLIPDNKATDDAIYKLDNEKGCPYIRQCRYATRLCREEKPQLNEITQGHFVACHLL